MKKVLILEDNVEIQRIFSGILREKVELFQAHDLKEAEDMYEANKDSLDLIALDGNVPTGGSRFRSAVELAKYIKEEYTNAIYSISSSDEIRGHFKKLEFDGILLIKAELIQKVMDILDIKEIPPDDKI